MCKCDSYTRILQMNAPNNSALLLLFFFLSLSKSPGGHEIYRRNARVIEMQNVTPDRPININCELHVAKKFCEWQPAFIKHKISQAIGFSKECGGGGGGGGAG